MGIPALAALIAGDSRIKVEVTEQLYAPIIRFTEGMITFRGIPTDVAARINAAGLGALTFQGRSMDRWLAARCFDLAVRSTKSRSFRATYELKQPFLLTFVAEGLLVPVTALEIRGALTVRWFTKVHRIDASNGLYDYLKRRVVGRLNNFQFQIKDVNIDDWGMEVDVSEVPPWYLQSLYVRKPEKHSMWVSLMQIKGLPGGDPAEAPDLSSYVEKEEIVDDE